MKVGLFSFCNSAGLDIGHKKQLIPFPLSALSGTGIAHLKQDHSVLSLVR